MKLENKNLLFLVSILTLSFAVVIFWPHLGDINMGLTKNHTDISYEEVRAMAPAEELAYWQEKIKELGDKEAYKHFSDIYSPQSYNEQHTHAHVFGEALFKESGIKGVTVCDSRFGFGCYHSFFGWALTTHGTGIINDLDEACIAVYGEKGLGCQHGIGHGVLAEMGYDLESLKKSLSLCSTLNWQGPIGGCTSGAIMEYNFDTMGDGHIRDIPEGDMHYPCTEVEERHKEACYFDQPQWWLNITGNDYARVGKLCDELDENNLREACYRGVGNMVAGTREYDVDGMLDSCSYMPEEESRLLCIEGATWLMSAQPEFEGMWEEMCAELKDDAKERCLESKDFI